MGTVHLTSQPVLSLIRFVCTTCVVGLLMLYRTLGDAVGQAGGTMDTCSVEPTMFRVNATGFTAELQNDNVLLGTFRDNRYNTTAAGWTAPITSFSLWFAGNVDGEQRITANNASVSAFRPGMFSGGERPSDCSSTLVYRISRNAIDIFRRTGVISDEMASWPVHLGAPVLDGDGIRGNYNIQGGDVPLFNGDVSYWWLMSDWSGRSQFSMGLAMDLEVAVSAFYFNGAGMLANTLFLSYEVENKSMFPILNARIAAHITPNFPDGLAGTDTTRGMVFAYNANELETAGVGVGPPAAGVLLIRDPAEDNKPSTRRIATSNIYSFIASEPTQAPEFLNAMSGRNPFSGFSVYEGAFGNTRLADCHSDFMRPVTVMFPGNPLHGAFWSMEQLMPNGDGCVTYRSDGSRQSQVAFMSMTTHEAETPPGGILSYTFALTWAQGTDRLESVRILFEYADVILQQRDVLLSPTVSPQAKPSPDAPTLALSQIAPNPFSGSTSISFSTPMAANLEIGVYDLLGRRVGTVADGFFDTGSYSRSFNATGLPPGVYYVRFSIVGKVFTRSIVVM